MACLLREENRPVGNGKHEKWFGTPNTSDHVNNLERLLHTTPNRLFTSSEVKASPPRNLPVGLKVRSISVGVSTKKGPGSANRVEYAHRQHPGFNMSAMDAPHLGGS